jgi:hypothetical protein
MESSYARKEICRAINDGPADGEDFFRLKVGGSHHVNVTPSQALAIAMILDPAALEHTSDVVIGATIRSLASE